MTSLNTSSASDQSSLFDTPSPLKPWQGGPDTTGDLRAGRLARADAARGGNGREEVSAPSGEVSSTGDADALRPVDDLSNVSEAAWRRDEASIQQLFERFHSEHPEVYDLLVRFARELKSRGHEHAGIGLIWERMRWESALGADRDVEPFRLNNDFRSRYSRLIAEREPDLADFFRTRELRAS